MFSDGLGAMVQMGDDKVRRENRHRIAEDQIFASVEDAFLSLRQTIQAEETSPFARFFFATIGQATFDSSGIVLEADRKPATGQIPLFYALQRFVAFSEVLPGLFLLRQELKAKSRKTLFPCIKGGISLPMKPRAPSHSFVTDEMTYRRFSHGEGLFPDKLKPHLSVKFEGPPIFYHHADPQFIEALFCGISIRRFEEPAAHSLSLKLRKKIQRRNVETILISVEEKSCVAGDLTIQLRNKTVHGRIIEHAEKGLLCIMNIEVGFQVVFRDET